MNTADLPAKAHHGRNVKRIREMFGIKQEALAITLGDDWSQKKISRLEEKEEIENDVLEEVAKALKVTPDAIKNFDEEKAVTFISNTFNDQSNGYNFYPVFNVNPVEKWFEALEEIKKLNQDKVDLLERMLKDRDGMIEELKKLVNKK